jgi:hypothetical protein
MARKDFVDQLREHGFQPEELGENRLAFRYVIPVGKFEGREVRLGFAVGEDFPLQPPSGPHWSPHLLPLHPSNDLPHPAGGIHASPFGGDWQYWSRPFPGWASTDRTVTAYMAHIRHLLETQ